MNIKLEDINTDTGITSQPHLYILNAVRCPFVTYVRP